LFARSKCVPRYQELQSKIIRELTNAMRDPLLVFDSASGLECGHGSDYEYGRR
jgi:hypothetical protein